jgi:hypothetical protein
MSATMSTDTRRYLFGAYLQLAPAKIEAGAYTV